MIGQLCALALAGGFAPSTVNDDQAFFAILAETKYARMVGMEVPDLGDLPPGFKLPAEVMQWIGKPARSLAFRLWSQGIAPDTATAWVAPPAGLKQGERLNLDLYRPKAAEKIRDFDPDSDPNFTIKYYWGSSETVKEGQPKIVKWSGLSEDEKEVYRQQARESQRQGSYYYKPNWTTGHWPTKSQSEAIDDSASLVGKYALTTNYTGNVEIEAPPNVEFLNAIEMSSPKLDKKLDLKKAIKFEWKSIPNVLGQNATIFGMEGKSTMILWSSSEVFSGAAFGDTGFMQMADVRDFVSKTIFMAPDRTSVAVPAGIFKDADMAMMTMAGYGPGAALDKAQPLPRIQTKTTLQLMLGGKKVDFAP